MTVFPTHGRPLSFEPRSHASPFPAETRGRRVSVLLFGVALLSLADLHLSLMHIHYFGLAESNPLAVLLFSLTGCVSSLAVLKLVTLSTALISLYIVRRSLAAEVGAWVCLTIMGVLGLWWLYYNDAVLGEEMLGPLMRQSGHALLLTG
ncbi:MAG: hypothetical protein AAGI30_03800 [Planctomycetota bacterium]